MRSRVAFDDQELAYIKDNIQPPRLSELVDAEFDETKHPRDKDGKFTSGDQDEPPPKGMAKEYAYGGSKLRWDGERYTVYQNGAPTSVRWQIANVQNFEKLGRAIPQQDAPVFPRASLKELVDKSSTDENEFQEDYDRLLDQQRSYSVPADAHAALRTYTSAGYQEVNECLRFKSCSDESDDTINAMYDTVKNAKLPEDVILYRGAALDEPTIESLGSTRDNTFQDKGFVSTSVKPGIAVTTGGEVPNTIFQIFARKGSAGLCVAPFSEYPEEDEVLLPAGAKFRYVGMKTEKIGNRSYNVVKAEYIG